MHHFVSFVIFSNDYWRTPCKKIEIITPLNGYKLYFTPIALIMSIRATLTQLVPFWSVEILRFCNLGNEYSMLFNLMINNILSFVVDKNIDEKFLILLGIITFLLYLLHKFDIVSLNFLKYDKSSFTITATITNDYVDMNETFKELNKHLIETYTITHLKLYNENVKIINSVQNLLLKHDLYLTVYYNETPSIRTNDKENNNSQQTKTVSYVISSYYIDLNNYVSSLKTERKSVILCGVENKTRLQINYPEILHAITHDLINNHGINNYTLMKHTENTIIESNDNKKDNTNSNKDKDNEVKDINKKEWYPTISSIDNLQIIDNLYISVRRNGLGNVYYELEEMNNDGKNSLIDTYLLNVMKTNKSHHKHETFKYSVDVLYLLSRATWYGNNETYTKTAKALHHYLIKKYLINDYISFDDDINVNLWNNNQRGNAVKEPFKIINNITHKNFNGEIKITIFCQCLNDKIEGKNLNKYFYKLESDVINVVELVRIADDEYSKHLEDKNINTIYHFTYIGQQKKQDGDISYSFSKKILSVDKDKERLNQTFDTIFNEHKDTLIADLNKLKDLTYYERTGMKRKKSYLFYGKPGTCKTNSVVAMALYDKRHIIEIPFSIIKSNEEMNYLMNVREIDSVKLTNDRIIYAFEEIDIGMKKFTRKEEDEPLESNANNNSNDEKKDAIIEKIAKNIGIKSTEQSSENVKLSLDTILSSFDGIGNYNGLVIVATANDEKALDASLTRDLRLTMVYHRESRQIDVIKIIENFFDAKITENLLPSIPDRQIIPAKLIALCDRNANSDVNDFVTNVLPELFAKTE